MSVAPPVSLCPICQHTLEPDTSRCAGCGASPKWQDVIEAFGFVQRRLEEWHKQGRLATSRFESLGVRYAARTEALKRDAREGKPIPADVLPSPRNQCWHCRTEAPPGTSHCASCGAPLRASAVQSLRYYRFLVKELTHIQENGWLSLAVCHELLRESRGRIERLRQRLEEDRILEVLPARSPRSRQPAAPSVPRPSLWQILLDPRSIQWLLAFGGGLLVVGLVVYLWTLGLFENKGVVAAILGLTTLTVLGGGWALILRTRYQMAGRALTLLACLVMPLNLWFYNASALLSLSEGGPLWLAALVCCVLYAASALVLRDALFVYVLMGGVALTGLLILADRNVNHFWEIAPPSTLLVVLGLIGLGGERAFPQGEGPFSRKRFGMAFFWSGHVLLGAGLLLLLGAQLGGWMHPALQYGRQELGLPLLTTPPAVVTEPGLRILALCLVLAGTAAYLYSDLVVRRVGVYIYLGVFTLLWAETLAVNLVPDFPMVQELVIALLALTGLAANLVLVRRTESNDRLARAGTPLALFLSTLPVLLGLALHLRATNATLHRFWPYDPNWGYVGALLAAALCCRAGAYIYRHTRPLLSHIYFFGTAAATLMSAAALVVLFGILDWSMQAPLLLLIPIAYLVAARLYRGHSAERPLIVVSHAAVLFMIATVLVSALHVTAEVFEPVVGQSRNLWLSLFFAEAALFYAFAATMGRQGYQVHAATASACAAVWQLLLYWGTSPEYFTLAFALLGFTLLVLYRLELLERWDRARLSAAAFQCANALMTLAFLAAVFLTVSRLLLERQALVALSGNGDWKTPLYRLFTLQVVLAVLGILAAWLVRETSWRRRYLVLTLLQAVLAFLVFYKLSELSPWQKLEIVSVSLGLVLLTLAHWGWSREMEEQNDLVSAGLLVGSVLAGLPLILAVLLHRWDQSFSSADELAMLVVGVALLGSGVLLRLMATTLTGGVVLLVYLLSMVLFIHIPERLQTMALWMALGGGAIFVLALLLSIYRDRLLTLPERVRRREGVFRILSWR